MANASLLPAILTAKKRKKRALGRARFLILVDHGSDDSRHLLP